MRADVDVEGARRRRRVDPCDGRRADARDGVLHLRERLARSPQQRAGAARHLRGDGRALEQRLAEELRRTGQRLGGPRRRPAGRDRGVGDGVEQDRGDVHARDSVHEGVVGLCDQREASTGHALHQPYLPQRLGAVEPLGEQPSGEPLERGVVGRSRKRRVADVVARVEVRIVGPHRPALPEGDVREPLAVARHEVQAAEHMVDQLLRRGRLALEHHHRRHVHVRGRVVLEVQKRRVQRR